MAFEDCYPVTVKLCGDCIQHIEYGEGECCHAPHHGDPRPYYILRTLPVGPFDDRPCATAVRLERRHRDVVDFTGGCHPDAADACEAHNRCADNPDGSGFVGFHASDCEGCGAGHGDRTHYTAWMRRDDRPERVIVRSGWTFQVRHATWSGGLYVVATHPTRGDRWCDTPYGGVDRWARVAAFVREVTADAVTAA